MRRALLLTLLLLLPACQPAAEGPGAPVFPDDLDPSVSSSPQLDADTVLVEELGCFEAAEIVTEDREYLRFFFTCDLNLQTGQIVVGIEDGGFLRRIESIEDEGGSLLLRTSQASIAEAVHNVSLSETIDLSDEGRWTQDLSGVVLFWGEVGGTMLQLKIESGSVGIDPQMHIDADWGWLSMDSFEIAVDVPMGLDMTMYASSTNGLHWTGTKDLFKISKPFYFQAGPLPVAGTVEFPIQIGAWVEAPGGFESTFGGIISGQATIGGAWDDDGGWTDLGATNFSAEAYEPTFGLTNSLKLKPFLRVEPIVKFYGVAGPALRGDAFVQAKADATCPGIDWGISAGVDTKAALKINILDKFKAAMLFPIKKWETELSNGFIEWPFEVPEGLCGDTDISCGDSVEYATNWPGSSSWNGEYSCLGGDYAGNEVVHKLVLPEGPPTRVEAWLESTSSDHQIFVMEGHGWAGDGPFDAGACVSGGTFVDFQAATGTDYWIVVDSAQPEPGGYRLAVSCEEPDEICDDGLDNDGNGDIDCDDAVCAGDAACGAGSCEAVATLSCGEIVSGDTSTGENTMGYYPCNVGNYSGPETVYEWTSTVSGEVKWKLVDPRPTVLDQDVIVIDGGGGCAAEKCQDWGGNSVIFDAIAGNTYYLVIDGYNGDAGAFSATLDCDP
jgi:hypothetical protein